MRTADRPSNALPGLPGNAGQAGPTAEASYTLTARLSCSAAATAADYWRGSSPWGLLVGLLLGIIVGFYELARTVWQK